MTEMDRMMYEVQVEITNEHYILHWPWGRELYFTGPAVGGALVYAHTRISEWMKKRRVRNDFFKQGWDTN